MAGSSSDSSIKFLCCYGGRILPRYPDGKLRYHGGVTRVLSGDRFVSFSELVEKFEEMCGIPINLRCQLPTEDLDALVSVSSDEDLANLLEEYDRTSSKSASFSKIRVFLYPRKKEKRASPLTAVSACRPPAMAVDKFLQLNSPAGAVPSRFGRSRVPIPHCGYYVPQGHSSDFLMKSSRH